MHIGKWKITIKDFVWFCICLVLILCFFIGLFVYNSTNAFDILSGASTAVSIVLSLVAILYSMIEGSSSAQINQETKNQLSNIDKKLSDVTTKIVDLKEKKQDIRNAVPILYTAIQEIEKSSSTDSAKISEEVKQNLVKLKEYIDEDIDD